MNVVVIVPTGLGATIGGGCGDATPVIRMLASICDVVITHPNVVNGADINEMTENTWYVEGSMIDRFLSGEIKLKKPKSNRILFLANELTNETLNSAGAARATLGIEINVQKLRVPLLMSGGISDRGATASHSGVDRLIEQCSEWSFDALAVQSPIDVDYEVARHYMTSGRVNPWGRVEAEVSREISLAIGKPTAHAPLDTKVLMDFNEVVSDAKASEMVSISYIHCIFKGLSAAPRISKSGLSVDDIDLLISPYGCIGEPHRLCFAKNIPVVVVCENKTVLNETDERAIYIENYLEAAGIVASIQGGLSPTFLA